MIKEKAREKSLMHVLLAGIDGNNSKSNSKFIEIKQSLAVNAHWKEDRH